MDFEEKTGGSAASPKDVTATPESKAPAVEEKYTVEDLFNAVRYGTRTHVAFILEKDSSLVNQLDSQGFSCMHWAAKRGDLDVLYQLRESGANLDVAASFDTQMRPIHWAASDGRLKSIKFLLDHRCDINGQDGNGCSPAIIAAQYGRTEALIYLVKNGADLNQRDHNGDTALHWAAYKGYEEVTGVLMHFMPQFKDLPDNFGQTPVHLAALRGNFEVLEYLVADFQASTTIRDKNGCTPLMLAVKKEQYKTEWVLRRLTSRSTWELIAGIGLSRLKNKTILSYLFIGCGDAEVSRWIWRLSFASNFFASYVALQYAMTPVLGDYPTLHMVNIMLHLTWWALFLMCLWKCPGLVPHEAAAVNAQPRADPKSSNSNKANGASAEDTPPLIGGYHPHSYDAALVLMGSDAACEENSAVRLPPVCHTCRVQKPLRSKHCKVARQCVCKFDHFCPFIYNTVGRDNYKYFVSLLAVHPVAYVLFLYTTVIYWYRAPLSWLYLAFMVYSFGMFVAVGGLGMYHLRLIMRNLTTNEEINMTRYTYLRNEFNAYSNPFCVSSKLGNLFDGLFPSTKLYYTREEVLKDKRKHACCDHDHDHDGCHEQEGRFEEARSQLLLEKDNGRFTP